MTTSFPIGTIITWYNPDFTVASYASGFGGNIPNPITTTLTNQTVSFECKTGQCFPNGNYYFTYQESGKCVSALVSDCSYGTSGASAVPTITTSPITTSTTSIQGTCASIATGALINIYANGVFLKSTTVTSATTWTISGLNLSTYSCGTITVKEADGGKCPTSGASGVTITRQAVKPVINFSGCTTTSPVTSISGFSTEPTGTTITLYKTNSGRTSLGTTTVNADGTWTKSGLSLVSGDIIVAAASGTCVTASSDSNPITITTQTNVSSYTINITTPSEGQTSVSGTISGGSYPITIKAYVDQNYVGSGVVVNAAGAWTVSGLNAFDLAAGSTVKITVTNGVNCESDLSSTSATVSCVSPSDKTVSVPSTLICYGTSLPVTIINSENGTIYQLYNGASKSGSSVLGTGSDIILNSSIMTSAATLTYKATKISPVSCDATLTGNSPVNVNHYYYSNGSEMISLGNWFSNSNNTGINACAFVTSGDYFIIPNEVTTAAGNHFTTGADVTFQVDGVANFNTYIATVPILINNGKVQFSGVANGFAISTGTVEYNRNDGTDQTVGSGTYYNLWISGSGKKVLAGDVVVNNIFDLHTAGYLDLNGHNLTINNWANGHIPTLTADRYIILNGGTITVNDVNSGETVQFPMSLSTAATDYCRVDISNNDNAHTTFTITNVFNYSNNLGTSSGGTKHTTNWVDLTYNISSSSTNANVTLYWDESKELTGFNHDNSQMNHYNGISWEKKGISGASTVLSGTIRYITASTNSFSPYGIGNDGSTLPIELSHFSLSKENDKININWITQSETNNDFFTVYKSNNGENWESIFVCKGAGTTTKMHTYNHADNNPFNGLNYYRIKQTDFDGQYSYSTIKSIDFTQSKVFFDVYPNPALLEELNISITGTTVETATLSIEDVYGRLVCSGTIEISKSTIAIKLSDICELAPGTYNISLNTNGTIENKRVIIK